MSSNEPNMKSLTEQIAAVLRNELSLHGDEDELYEGTISAGELAQSVTDLLIDLAGTGRLLASIDRIARPQEWLKAEMERAKTRSEQVPEHARPIVLDKPTTPIFSR